MKVSGFTFVRNAVKFDFPVVEAITSVLPLCDEFVVALGNSEDTTEDLIASIDSPKIKIIPTVWDDTLREGGKVFAVETDKAFQAISKDSCWAFYIQADEVLHEKFHKPVRAAMDRYRHDLRVEGLLFDYLHFYGSYKYVGNSISWYRREARVIRNSKHIKSYRDAQGFRSSRAKKLRVKKINASIYHYGWVRHPEIMQNKQKSNARLNHGDKWVEKNMANTQVVDYASINSLRLFRGTHPAVMKARLKAKNWDFDYDVATNTLSLKEKIKKAVEKWTGWRIGEFRNYKII